MGKPILYLSIGRESGTKRYIAESVFSQSETSRIESAQTGVVRIALSRAQFLEKTAGFVPVT